MQTLSTASRPSFMQQSSRQLFLGAAVAIFFTLTLVTLAQTPQPAVPENPAPPAIEAPAAAPAVTPGPAPAAAASATPAVEPAKSELRDLTAAPAAEVEKKDAAVDEEPKSSRRSRRSHRGDNDRVSVMGETHVLAGELIEGAAVGVMADVIVDGEVTGDAVAVLGDNRINGTVRGNAVCVLGDIYLGPKAKVGGDIVCVTGDVHREPGAEVGGKIIKKTIGSNRHFGPGFNTWWQHGLKLGRPLATGPGMSWLWLFTVFMVAFYVVLALVFPGGVRKTGDMLVRRPVAVIVSSILTILALPVLFVLLLITIVGIPVALLVLPVGMVLAVIFGKAAIYGLVGRGLTADKFHPALAVFIGAILFVLLYLVPVAGLMLSLLVALLGLGCVVTALLASDKKLAPAGATASQATSVPPPLAPMTAEVTAPPMAFAAAAAPAGASPTWVPGPMVAPTPPFAQVPPASAAMPRAGFWIRTGALFIDGLIIAVCFGPWAGPAVLPLLALYGALMWKFRGTTVGGIVCGLQVVRLDDRPLDWPTAVVRALGCFLSLAVIGLGFVWVAFDDEKQSWHDKIAGTTVVRPQKRVSLV